MATRMDEAARARLKAAGEAKRGRKSLIGLDPGAWSAALDATLGNEVRIGREVGGQASELVFPGHREAGLAAIESATGPTDPFGVSLLNGGKYVAHDTERNRIRNGGHPLARWGYLRRMRDGMGADLAALFPSALTLMSVFKDMATGRRAEVVRLHPLGHLVRVLAFLWRDRDEFRESLAKYLVPVTGRYVNANPVPGSRVRLLSHDRVQPKEFHPGGYFAGEAAVGTVASCHLDGTLTVDFDRDRDGRNVVELFGAAGWTSSIVHWFRPGTIRVTATDAARNGYTGVALTCRAKWERLNDDGTTV